MGFEVRVTTNARMVGGRISRLHRRQLPFATAAALTDTAKDAQSDAVDEMSRVFDRPTPFTKRGVGVRAARKTRLVARVFIKDRQADYLGIQVRGGTRYPKRRAILVPANARLNRYGNMSRNQVARLLARDDTFSGRVRGVAGIWQRKKRGGLKLLVAYEPRAQYQKRFDFPRVVRRTVERTFERNFATRWRYALRTAR